MAIAKAVNRFSTFLRNASQELVTVLLHLVVQPTTPALRRRGHTRLHAEHPDTEEWGRPQNSVEHKPFACKREFELATAGGPLFFAERTRLLANEFEAMRDRKKSRNSRRFVPADAVAHL
jgi:hypothetical protein